MYQNLGLMRQKKQLPGYYRSNINPIIQCGILVFGSCSFCCLMHIPVLQKKILKKFIYLWKTDESSNIFHKNKFFHVYEFHIYELLQFFFMSIANSHGIENHYCLIVYLI